MGKCPACGDRLVDGGCPAARQPCRSAADAIMRTAKVSCLGCDRLINPKYTICAACAEDMGYGRRAR